MKGSLAAPAPFDVVAALEPVRLRLGLMRVRALGLRGAAVGAGAALAVLAVSDRTGTPGSPLPAGLGLIAAGILLGMVWGARQWPDPPEAARAADRHFVLHDRLTTALQFTSSDEVLPGMQRADVARRIDGLPLARSGNAPLHRWEAALTAGLLLAFAALLLAGGTSPRHARSVAAAGDERRIHRIVSHRLPQISRGLQLGLTPTARKDPALRKLEHALAALRRQLAHAPNRVSALRSISATQQELHRIAGALHPVRPRAVAQLNSALNPLMTRAQRAGVAGGDRKALDTAAAVLRHLAARATHMTPAQRAALARSLAQAANATGDSRLQAALRSAASSLGYDDPQSAAKSLQAAAAALSRSPTQVAAQFRLAAAQGQLDSLKNDVSGVASAGGERTAGATSPSSGTGKAGAGSPGTGAGSSAPGKGAGAGSGKSGGSGSGSGKSSAAGSGTGKGSGRGQGAPGAGSGSGGTGGHGIGGGRGGAGQTGQGRYATVYVPYKEGKGARTIQTGPNGSPQSGPIVPYRQVVAQYGRTAHQALDRADLPPALRAYVRQYFSTVSH